MVSFIPFLYFDQESREARQHPHTPAPATSSVINALDEAWFRRLPDFPEIKEAAAKVDITTDILIFNLPFYSLSEGGPRQ